MILKSKIFRAYDIRGIAFQDFDEDGFYVVSQSFCKYIAKKYKCSSPKIFVSGDARQSLSELSPAVLAGLTAGGAEVTWGGSIPTPINYFAFHEGDFDASLQITASHNPADYNGMKFVDRNGAVCGEEIQAIKEIAECIECGKGEGVGMCADTCQEISFVEKYEQKLRSITSVQKKKKIVVDCGNGIAGMFFPQILKHFGHEITELYCDIDTTFPNHQPDPERIENLRDLIQMVQEKQADFGFAFDGDGDRIGIVLSNGTVINADKILYVLASDFLSRNKNASIVVDAMSSAMLMEKIKSLGGIPVLSKTGHSYIEEKMKETNSLLGGEQSGHFMLGENFYGHDDALLAGLRFLNAVEKTPLLLDEVTTGWPTLLEFSEKFEVPDETKFEVMQNVSAELLKQFPQANTLDGIRIDFGNSEWGIVRCSNTSPKIAVRIEACDQKSLEEKKEILTGVLQKLI